MSDNGKEYTGSCHCGAIKYTVTLTPEQLTNPTATRCNCTWCQKAGLLGFEIPGTSFKLISPASKSEMGDYSPKGPPIHRYFCTQCGSHVLREGWYEYEGQKIDFCGLNLVTLDQPQDGLELSDFKVDYWDGKHDNWMAGKGKTPFKAGVV